MKIQTFIALALLAPLYALAQSAPEAPVYGSAPTVANPTQPPKEIPTGGVEQKKSRPQIKAAPGQAKGPELLQPPSEASKKFYVAIQNGNLEIADYLLQQGADINCMNCGFDGPPLVSLYRQENGQGPAKLLVWLLSKGANPNLANSSGATLSIKIAASVTNEWWSGLNDFLYLLDRGATATVKDNNGNTTLHYLAASSPQSNPIGFQPQSVVTMHRMFRTAFDKLMSKGADINATATDRSTPLMKLAARCNAEQVKVFLSAGANPALKNIRNETALSIAIDTAASRASNDCNAVVGVLKNTGNLAAFSNSYTPEAGNGVPAASARSSQDMRSGPSSLAGDWQGVFNATSPRQGTAKVTASILLSGETTFISSSGLRGSGRIDENSGRMNGSFSAKSPLDAQGRPVFGANEIQFDLTGNVADGVMRGRYTSTIESGDFAICNKAAIQTVAECTPSAGIQGVTNAIDGLLKALSRPR
jgi:hypothetical protein